jgi:hypothetical protein
VSARRGFLLTCLQVRGREAGYGRGIFRKVAVTITARETPGQHLRLQFNQLPRSRVHTEITNRHGLPGEAKPQPNRIWILQEATEQKQRNEFPADFADKRGWAAT